MRRFTLQFNTDKPIQYNNNNNHNNYFNKDMNYYICSYGGSGSTVLSNYLSNFGNVYHIHDRYPPKKLTYVGQKNTTKEIYNEWFNDVEIPKEELKNYKIIFIYKHPIPVIFSRFAQAKGPNIPHLRNIKCINNGNIYLADVLIRKKDLYGIEEFYDNYTIPTNRNYEIYAVKYELFWSNISLFNKIIEIPDVKELYPIKLEHFRKYNYIKELGLIYNSLINKMNNMTFIKIINRIENEEDFEN